MANTPTHPVSSFVILLNRLSLGLYFAIAGWNKLLVEFNSGFGSFYRGEGFQGMKPLWLPEWVAASYGYALPWLELVLGVLLVIGLFGRLAALGIALLLASIAIALIGKGEFMGGGPPFHHTGVFFTLALMLALIGPGGFSIDAFRGRGRGRASSGKSKPAA